MPMTRSFDRKYEAVVSTTASVVYVTVSGFVEKRQKYWFPDYLFVLEVYWTNKRTSYIKRSYSDILKLHSDLRTYFAEKNDKDHMTSSVFIPNLEGRKLFRQNSIDLAETREAELQAFFRELIGGNPLISSNKVLVDFFCRRPDDPLPADSPDEDGIHSDSAEDEVLFDR